MIKEIKSLIDVKNENRSKIAAMRKGLEEEMQEKISNSKESVELGIQEELIANKRNDILEAVVILTKGNLGLIDEYKKDFEYMIPVENVRIDKELTTKLNELLGDSYVITNEDGTHFIEIVLENLGLAYKSLPKRYELRESLRSILSGGAKVNDVDEMLEEITYYRQMIVEEEVGYSSKY